jgi:uncharacterized protein (TIGR00290 family)
MDDHMTATSIKDRPFFCSWSGGKDSCLALYRGIQMGGVPKALFTMLTEDGKRSRSHGLPRELIERQAQSLGVPLVCESSSWEEYEDHFLSALETFKQQGIECGVFGDIDLEGHLEWVERVCSAANMIAFEPLWQENRSRLLTELLHIGFQATIVAVKADILDSDFLGKVIDEEVIAGLARTGIDPSGEEGEYHTMVTNGPIFSFPVQIQHGDRILQDGYCFLDIMEKSMIKQK